MITITIETDNAAFADGQQAGEVARILHGLADAITRNDRVADYILRDVNGNRVGQCTSTDQQ